MIPNFMQLQAYWVRSEPYRFVSVLEIAEAFQTSKIGQENAARLAQPFQQDERSEAALVRKRYALSGEHVSPPDKMVPIWKALLHIPSKSTRTAGIL